MRPPQHGQAAAITGLGAVTPHGAGVTALWNGVVAGRPTAGPITAFDASAHRVGVACEVPGATSDLMPRRIIRQTDRFAQLALIAAEEALGQAGLVVADPTAIRNPLVGVDPTRVGVVIASGAGGVHEVAAQHDRLRTLGPDRVRPYLSIAMPLNMAAGQVGIRHGAGGPTRAVVSACASAADALGSALDLLRAGRADVVIAGGTEACVDALMMAGFDAAGALSREGVSRPFDVARDGFVAGEGAGVMVLETRDHAERRGARVLGLLAGYGATGDAHDPTQPRPDGAGAARAMRLALADAGVDPEEVGHVNAHATSTPAGDMAESAAIGAVFGSRRVPVTAPKGSIGHLMGAAGAVEGIIAVQSLRSGVVPPTAGLADRDPACDVDVVVESAPAGTTALSNSFGFGGHNASLVFALPDGGLA